VRVAIRVYRDYLQPDGLDELRRLVGRSLELGYQPTTLSAFAADPGAGDRVLLLRHDIDSDVRRARRMWEIERRASMVGSWFFRRSTWDVPFMRELAAAGCDVGYHYEELSTLVKERGAATGDEARALIAPARDRLRAALDELRAGSRLPLDVLASHGDFANRAVDVSNVELLDDRAFRREIGVRFEAYDIAKHLDARATDGAGGRRPWWPSDPLEALERGARVVEVLVHPRAWGAAPLVNARLDLDRLVEGARYAVRRRRRT
jgi:hypothetical protein